MGWIRAWPPTGQTSGTAAYGALAYLAWGRLRTLRAHIVLTAATAVFVGLICFSRLYLGVHYLSDVLGGIAGGAFWLALSVALLAAYADSFTARFSGSRLDRLGRRLVRAPPLPCGRRAAGRHR